MSNLSFCHPKATNESRSFRRGQNNGQPARKTEAIGNFPVAFFVIYPVFSGRIPIFAKDLRYSESV